MEFPLCAPRLTVAGAPSDRVCTEAITLGEVARLVFSAGAEERDSPRSVGTRIVRSLKNHRFYAGRMSQCDAERGRARRAHCASTRAILPTLSKL